MQEMTSGSVISLEKEMAIHSSISCLGKSMDRSCKESNMTEHVCAHAHAHTHTHTHTELIRSTVDRTQKYLDFFNPKLPGLSNWWGFASTREWLWRIFSCVPFSLAQYTYPQFYTYLQFFNMAINIFLTYWYKVYKRTSKLPHFNPHYNFATPYPLNDNWGENSLKSISC